MEQIWCSYIHLEAVCMRVSSEALITIIRHTYTHCYSDVCLYHTRYSRDRHFITLVVLKQLLFYILPAITITKAFLLLALKVYLLLLLLLLLFQILQQQNRTELYVAKNAGRPIKS